MDISAIEMSCCALVSGTSEKDAMVEMMKSWDVCCEGYV